MAEIPPAWHPDPTGAHDHRWWDGQRWTEHVADAGVAAVDPLPAAPPQADRTTDQGSSENTDLGTAGGTAAAGTAAAGTVGQRGSDQPAWPGTEGGNTPAWETRDSRGGTPAPGGDPTKTSGMAITALVLGLLAIPSAIVLIGGLLGLVAIILGAVAAGKAKRGETGGRGVAVGGIVAGSLGLLIAIGLFIAVFSTIAGDVTACIEETGDPAACQEELERDLLDRFG